MISPKDKKDFLKSFDLVFCDCDGVLWYNLFDAIPGSSEAIQFLRSKGKRVVFVTNNSISSTENQIKKFAKSNIIIEKEDLVHPAESISNYLQSIKFDGLILAFASLPFKEHLKQQGHKIVEEKERLIDGSVMDLRNAIYSTEPIEAVVIDVDYNLTAWKLMRAQIHLRNPNCLFIAGAADMKISFGGTELIGPGVFVEIAEKASKRKAMVFGKPGWDLSYMLKQKYNITDPKRVLIIGDSLGSDIKFGKMCGFQTLLVLTGGTKTEDLQNLCTDEKPDFVIQKLEDLKKLD